MTTVIIGASLAGLRTAEELRHRGYDDPIVLIGDEPHLPYDRPPLSKEIVAGEPPEPVLLRPVDELETLGLSLRLGEQAVALDPTKQVIQLADGDSVGYDHVVIATGARARRPYDDVPGAFTLRTIDDARGIAAAAGSAERVVVIGAGFIGCEAASALSTSATEVVMLNRDAVVLNRGLGETIGALMSRRVADAGVRLRSNVRVDALLGADRLEGVRLHTGELIRADLVVIGIGAIPNDEWLAGSGLVIDDGVNCDQHCRAIGFANIYAVGDVARCMHPRYGRSMRIEHWTNAQELAAIAAANITGETASVGSLPYVWSSQFGAFIQVFGRIGIADDTHFVHGDGSNDSWVAVTGSGGHLTAAVGLNAMREIRPYRKLVEHGAPVADALTQGRSG